MPHHTIATTRSDASRPRRVGKRPGPKPTFSLGDAVRAALSLGIDRFTMGGVARELGVAPSALYRVVPDRDALIREALASILSRRTPPPADLPWQDQLRALADGAWELLDEYPGLAAVTVVTPHAEDAAGRLLSGALEALVSAGLPAADAVFALDFVLDTVTVSHLGYRSRKAKEDDAADADVSAQPPTDAADLGDRAESLASGAAPSEVFVPEAVDGARGWLSRKIELIIGGIEAGLAS
ncbi:TetR/AcrR family transcriptional regulator [Corynebacterium sp. 335C]